MMENGSAVMSVKRKIARLRSVDGCDPLNTGCACSEDFFQRKHSSHFDKMHQKTRVDLLWRSLLDFLVRKNVAVLPSCTVFGMKMRGECTTLQPSRYNANYAPQINGKTTFAGATRRRSHVDRRARG